MRYPGSSPLEAGYESEPDGPRHSGSRRERYAVYWCQKDWSFEFLFALLLPAPIIDMIAQRHGLAKPKELCLTVHGCFCPNTSMARLEEQSTPPSVNRRMPHGYMLIRDSVGRDTLLQTLIQ